MNRYRHLMLAMVALTITSPDFAQAADDIEAKFKQVGFKRRNKLSDEDLRKQLFFPPEYGFDQNAASVLYESIKKAHNDPELPRPRPEIGCIYYAHLAQAASNPAMTAFPWRTGTDCQTGKDMAERMHVLSVNLRRLMRESITANDVRPDPDKLLNLIDATPIGERRLEWGSPESVPTLIQMLQVENAATRKLMVRLLSRIKGKEASVALAQRAVFDLSAELRQDAVEALKNRLADEFKDVLLKAIRSPWPAASEHAAEAIAALELKSLVPELVGLLGEPDPRFPFVVQGKTGKTTMIREMVRINHMTNCCLCHALSSSKDDLVRGRIPTPGQELPPSYYQADDGLFVRADMTYLRQDFSVFQPVENPGKWPAFQRYDYLVRTRTATTKEISVAKGLIEKKLDTYPQREAILFALREITGRDLGNATEKWKTLLDPIEKK